MRKTGSIRHIKAMLISILIFIIMLTGCMPPNYTSDHKKELTDQHLPDVTDWFEKNMPQARVRSGNIYSDGINLCSAMEGTYVLDGESYRYIYDYFKDEMFIEDGYSLVCEIIRDEICEILRIDSDIVYINFESDQIPANTDNDDEKYPSSGTIKVDGLIPYGEDPGDYAYRSIHEGTLISYYVYVYGDEIPEYDHDTYASLAKLGFVKYIVPAGYEYSGICSAIYDDDSAEYTYAELEKLDKGLYAGYIASVTGEYDSSSGGMDSDIHNISDFDLSCELKSRNQIKMTVPPEAKPIIFSDKKRDFAVERVRSDGQVYQVEMDFNKGSDVSQYTGHYISFGSIVVPDEGLYGYSFPYAIDLSADGIYDITIG